jgi:formate hydrogenlyase subunit 5
MSASTAARRGTSYVAALRQKLPNSVLEESWQTPDQVTVTVTREALPEAVETLYYGHDGWMSVVVGSDERKLNGNFAIYYVLSMEGAEKSFVVVRALVPPDSMEFPSVSPKVPAAVWGEREVRDVFGMRPVGLPDERRLVLPDDWPDDLYPLRKDAMDYRLRPEIATETETYKFINEAKSETTEVPLGPLHITSDEPGHFRLFVDGEDIIDADYRLFYVHRGMEKLAETRMGYNDVTFLADRICGICGFAHSVAYASAVENALDIHAPPRAATIRTILLEVERLHSHLLNLGLACHFVGFDTGFMHFFRVREKSMELAELLTGSRKTYALNLIGGVRRDILAEQNAGTRKVIAELRTEVTRLLDILLSTGNMRQRLEGIGLLDRKVARDHSPVGPTVRGSGYRRDVRFDHPYAGYAGVPIGPRVLEAGDVLSRVLVRAQEFFDSIAIIEHCLDNAPGGPVLVEGFTYTPYRFALGYTEAPRGEDIHWCMLGDNQKVHRIRFRAPTYNNWPSLRYMLRGNTVSDAPIIIASIDPCYSCTDRVTVVDVRKRHASVIPYKEMERYSRERTNSPLK